MKGDFGEFMCCRDYEGSREEKVKDTSTIHGEKNYPLLHNPI